MLNSFVRAHLDLLKSGPTITDQHSREVLQDLVRTVAPSPDLDELAWTLEELRVSSFAQHLRTPVPVSEKRIRKEIHRLARGL